MLVELNEHVGFLDVDEDARVEDAYGADLLPTQPVSDSSDVVGRPVDVAVIDALDR